MAKAFTESLLNNMSMYEKSHYGLTVPAEAVSDHEWEIEEAGNEGFQSGWSEGVSRILSVLGEMDDKRRRPAALARWLRANVEMD